MNPVATAASLAPRSGPPAHTQPLRQQYLDLRASVHRKLLNRLNLEALAHTDRSRAESDIRMLLGQLLAEESTPLSLAERETLFVEVLDDVFGLGPLEPLLSDPTITDILVNTHRHVFVERGGLLATFSCSHHVTPVLFEDICRQAAGDAGLRVRILATLTQSPDHPVILTIPETHYLTGLLLELT
jgi:hypothetical protein